MSDDFWGGMFDFNEDGIIGIGEEWIGYNIIEDCIDENDEQF